MSKKMLINALHAEEARVAIVEDGRLVDLDVEIAGSEQIRGNIYKGVVVRVEPGLQAAFVDIGLKKLGFLQMGELHPENWRWRDDITEDQRHRRPRIQEILRRGQELIVQVEKGERDNKGSALTTYASLPGRYMVLMPGSDSSGISRKVESDSERKKLKEIIAEMTIPEGYGYIIRTEAMGRTRDELQKDLDSLIALYRGVMDQGAEMKGAGVIYQESSLFIRTIRDYFSADIDEVLVDSKDVYKQVRECLKEIDPEFEKLVKLHQEKRPIFSRYQLEEQIDLIYEKKVPLKSGGSIFIEPTEALVSIDVNSGKSTGEKGVEDTAFKTNLEAAEEAARQLRLRDLGGLIVIDFIDMRDRKHNIEVEKTLKTALKSDKARVNVARISEFGLLEMSRQRIRQTLNQASTLECPHCDGRGKVKSVEAMALSFLRKVHAAAAKGTTAEVVGSLPLEVAYYLLNRKRGELAQIEKDYDIEVTVKGKPSFLLNQMELEVHKREKLPEEPPQEKQPQRAKEETPQEGASAEGRKKKKRGKAKPQSEEEVPAFAVEPPAAAVEAAEEMPLHGEPAAASAEGESEEQKKKKRRKRKRGKGGADAAAAGEPVLESLASSAPPVAASGLPVSEPAEGVLAGTIGPEAEGEAHPAEEGKKKRRRKRRRGKGGQEAAAAETGSASGEGAGESTSLMDTSSVSEASGAVAEHGAASEEKPKKSRRSRKKKGAHEASPQGASAEASGETSLPASAESASFIHQEAHEAKAAAEPAPAEPVATPEKPKASKGTRGPRAAKKPKAETASSAEAVPELNAPAPPAEAVAVTAKDPQKKKKPASKPKRALVTEKPQEQQESQPSAASTKETAPANAVESAPEKPKRASRANTSKSAVEPAAQDAEEKPKKPRAPRKKKEEPPA